VDRARVAASLAALVLERLEPLKARGEISDREIAEARARLEEAQIAGRSAESRREILIAGPRPEAVAELEARVAKSASEVEAAAARLAYYELRSPIDGVLDRIHCHPGQVLAAGAPAAEVVDPGELLVTGGVSPPEAAQLREGQAARVRPGGPGPAGDSAPLEGTVHSVGVQTDPSTGAVPVRVLVKNPAGRLHPGMLVSVEIVAGDVKDALAVPDRAVVPAEEGLTVALLKDGKAVVVPVKAGLRQSGLTQIEAEGLKAGDAVIVSGAYNLPSGTPVKPAAPPKTP
jgi:RND family efflux transporter MFP subunit